MTRRRLAEVVVRAHLDAFSAKDLRAMLATMHVEADFVTGTTRVEPADFAEFFGWAMRELDPTITITRLACDDDVVACEFVESVVLDGARRSLNRAAFYTVRDGLITEAKVYDERD